MASKHTPKRESTFLGVLRRGGSIEAACMAAGFSRRSAFTWKAADASFAERWNDAREAGTDRIEDEAVRRAYEGFERPIYQGGKKVGTELVYSDRLMEIMLKARRPDVYRDRSSVEHSGPGGGPMEIVTDARTRIAGKLDAIARRKALRVIDGGAPATPLRADTG